MSTLGNVGEGAWGSYGAILGYVLGAENREEAEKLRKQAMAQYNIELPPLEEMQAQAVQSQEAQAQGSGEAQNYRLAALRKLSQRAGDGYNAEDMAAINATLNDVGSAERGSREAILRRIPANSGSQVAALLSNQQAAASRANQQGLDIAANGRRNALQALQGVGSLAGNIDESAFGQSSRRGQASDAMGKFNERNRLDAVRERNQAGANRFGQQMRLADSKSGAYRTAAEDEEEKERRRTAMYSGVGGAMGRGAGEGLNFFAAGGMPI